MRSLEDIRCMFGGDPFKKPFKLSEVFGFDVVLQFKPGLPEELGRYLVANTADDHFIASPQPAWHTTLVRVGQDPSGARYFEVESPNAQHVDWAASNRSHDQHRQLTRYALTQWGGEWISAKLPEVLR